MSRQRIYQIVIAGGVLIVVVPRCLSDLELSCFSSSRLLDFKSCDCRVLTFVTKQDQAQRFKHDMTV
jgi:hypothetical protein